jgi:putative spermidine/putrescine transport system permease protein
MTMKIPYGKLMPATPPPAGAIIRAPYTGRRIQDALFGTLVAAILVAAAVFFLLPVLIIVLLSFDARTYLGALPPTSFSLQWYYRFFSSTFYTSSLMTSLELALVSVAISVAAGSMAAVFLHNYRFPGRDTLLAFFMAPLIVPAVVIGFALVMFLGSVGVRDGFARLVAGHVLITLPYTIRSTLAGLEGIPPTLTEAALNLGASEHAAFWTITFPLARRGIVAGAIFAFSMSLDDVSVSIFLVEAPRYTLPIALLAQMRGNFDLTIAAVGTMFAIFMTVLIWVLDRSVGLDDLFGRGIYRTD